MNGRKINPADLTYVTSVGAISPHQIRDMFVGWPTPPSAQRLVDVMDGSYRRVWALDGDDVVGYINAISDGVLNAFIPWLEVRADYQGCGVGSELLRRIIAELDGMYAIDLCCDPELVPYYEKQGFLRLAGAGLRRPESLV